MLPKTVDPVKIIKLFADNQHLPKIKSYLKNLQPRNIQEVNDAYNEILILEGDDKGLLESISTFSKFTHIQLAEVLAAHRRTEFKRIAALVYKGK